MLNKSLLQVGLILLLLFGTGLIYAPGLSGGFVLDDFHNIVDNAALEGGQWSAGRLLEAATSTSAGPLGRPVAMFSFALDAWWHGLNPLYMKAANLLLHGITGLLVFLIANNIINHFQTRRDQPISIWPAILAAGIWLLHPIHTSAVLYVVQRMAVLSALFGCLSILAYLRARQAQGTRTVLLWLSAHLGALILAAYSKENGLLVLPLILAIEACVFRLKHDGQPVDAWLRRYIFAIAAGCVAAAVYLVFSWESFLGGYAYRGFSFFERVLTEPRVLWHYVGLMLAPIPHNFSLYKDGFALSSGVLEPASTALAVVGLVGVLGWAIWRSWRGPSLVAFGILWFLIGHAFESTIFPLEIVFEHRNYFPSIGLAIAVCGVLGLAASAFLGSGSRIVLGTLSAALLAGCTYVVATYWSNPVEHALISVAQHPESPRAQYAAGLVYFGLIQNPPKDGDPAALGRYVNGARQADHHLERAAELAPNSVGPLIRQMILYGDVPASAALFEEVGHRLAHARLRPAAGTEVYRLVKCVRRGDCPIDTGQLLAAIVAGADNTNASSRERAVLHLLAASLLAREFDDRDTATKHIEQARQLMPNDRHIDAHVRKFYDS